MSNSRKLKFRPVPRAPRYLHTKHAEPVPLANKFQELIEQDEFSPSHSKGPAQRPVNTAPTPNMAQRLQGLIEESASGRKRSSFDMDDDIQARHGIQPNRNSSGIATSKGAEYLRNDESETVDSDTSDHEDWTKSSAKVVVPMGQRLQELLEVDSSRSRQDKSKQRQKGAVGTMMTEVAEYQSLSKQSPLSPSSLGTYCDDAFSSEHARISTSNLRCQSPLHDDIKCDILAFYGPTVSNLELEPVFKEDDIEACDNAQMGTPVQVPLVTRPQPLPRIVEQFQEALMAAPSIDCAVLPSVQFPINLDYSTRLQRLLQLEKQQHAEITKGLTLETPLESIQVQILKKSLEGRLTTCKCQVIHAPSKWMGSSMVSSSMDQVQVIFNSKVAAELEIDVGCVVRINPPWQELTHLGSSTRIILCTYFCEAVH